MPNRMSLATIDSPEFINLQPLDINPLMSSCEIKVLYLGQNRNHSFIDEETAIEMSKTLRGAPIVGWYKKDKGDFMDHGDRITIDGDGIKSECLTQPYGFVAPDAKVWFQNFEDTDEFGNVITRKYLMTTGYLWTGQFEEAKKVLEEGGRPHSMELDEKTLQGYWSEDLKSGIDFFIINDAIFSKLCILGKDVEPCFEGSNITSQNVSSSFTIDENFGKTLYSMMQELKFALKGGQEEMAKEIQVKEDFSLEQDKNNEFSIEENQELEKEEIPSESFEKEKEDEDSKEEEVEKDKEEVEKDEDKEEEKKYSLLSEKYEKICQQYSELEGKYQDLVAFKEKIEEKQKDDLINSFYMLSDEDKKEVMENKSKYSLEEIESKLSVICVRKKVNFEVENTSDSKKENITTYNLNMDSEVSVPAWITAIKNQKKDNI